MTTKPPSDSESVKARPLHATILDAIIDYENGDLDHDETIALFQDLVNTGLAWQLQGSYGRQAMRLIEAGDVVSPQRSDDSSPARTGQE